MEQNQAHKNTFCFIFMLLRKIVDRAPIFYKWKNRSPILLASRLKFWLTFTTINYLFTQSNLIIVSLSRKVYKNYHMMKVVRPLHCIYDHWAWDYNFLCRIVATPVVKLEHHKLHIVLYLSIYLGNESNIIVIWSLK